ncbi:RecB family exonuclease [Paenibacillus chitinolyticus]|uniref:RecB family exonuclease n=1 Tax=Paenibacillus chitinolyticus TaxID=79263 RepID=UPI003D057844
MIVKPIKTEVAGIEIIEGYRLVTSYSQLDKYLTCPFSWFLKYIEKIQSDIKAKALEYGLAVHETMEFYFEMQKLGVFVPQGELVKYFFKTFKEHEIPFDSEDEEKDYYKEGIIAIDRIFNPVNEVERVMVDPENVILGVEEDFELEVELLSPIQVAYIDDAGHPQILEADRVYIIGFIDLVMRTKEGIVVIDHKSGKTLFDKHKLAENLQFPIYAMAILKKYGELPVRSYYNFTKLHKCQVLKLEAKSEKDHVLDEARLIRSKAEILGIFKKMNRPKHTAKPSFMCYWCDYSKHKLNVCKRSSDFKPKSAK